jgi:hypothetical protein
MGDKIFTAISVLIYLMGLAALIYAFLLIYRVIQI